MNEIIDKLVLRLIFTIFLCLMLYLYKYIHFLIYPSSRKQLFKKFYPSLNSADTLHLFGRIIGIAIVVSSLGFDETIGLGWSMVNFFLVGLMNFVFFLLSIFIMESIVLYNFEYIDEIVKRRNICYSLISFGQAIALSFLIRTLNIQASGSVVLFFLLWLLAMVLFGFVSKVFKWVSKIPFHQMMIKKNMALAFSYFGFILGSSVIINSIYYQSYANVQSYALQIVLKAILSAIILPIFRKGLMIIFELKEDMSQKIIGKEVEGPEFGYGLYEGATFFSACLLTSIITGHINFGTIYPIF